MSNTDDEDQKPVVVDAVEEPMVTDASAPYVVGASQLQGIGTWIDR